MFELIKTEDNCTKQENEKIEIQLLNIEEPWLLKWFQDRRKKTNDSILKLEHEINELITNRTVYEPHDEIIKIFKNPLYIRQNYDTDIKQLLLKVLFWDDLYYQKNEGLRTSFSGFPMRVLRYSKNYNSWNWASRDSNPGPPA